MEESEVVSSVRKDAGGYNSSSKKPDIRKFWSSDAGGTNDRQGKLDKGNLRNSGPDIQRRYVSN